MGRDILGPVPLDAIARGAVREGGVDLAGHALLEYGSGRHAFIAASMID